MISGARVPSGIQKPVATSMLVSRITRSSAACGAYERHDLHRCAMVIMIIYGILVSGDSLGRGRYPEAKCAP